MSSPATSNDYDPVGCTNLLSAVVTRAQQEAAGQSLAIVPKGEREDAQETAIEFLAGIHSAAGHRTMTIGVRKMAKQIRVSRSATIARDIAALRENQEALAARLAEIERETTAAILAGKEATAAELEEEAAAINRRLQSIDKGIKSLQNERVAAAIEDAEHELTEAQRQRDELQTEKAELEQAVEKAREQAIKQIGNGINVMIFGGPLDSIENRIAANFRRTFNAQTKLKQLKPANGRPTERKSNAPQSKPITRRVHTTRLEDEAPEPAPVLVDVGKD